MFEDQCFFTCPAKAALSLRQAYFNINRPIYQSYITYRYHSLKTIFSRLKLSVVQLTGINTLFYSNERQIVLNNVIYVLSYFLQVCLSCSYNTVKPCFFTRTASNVYFKDRKKKQKTAQNVLKHNQQNMNFIVTFLRVSMIWWWCTVTQYEHCFPYIRNSSIFKMNTTFPLQMFCDASIPTYVNVNS